MQKFILGSFLPSLVLLFASATVIAQGTKEFRGFDEVDLPPVEQRKILGTWLTWSVSGSCTRSFESVNRKVYNVIRCSDGNGGKTGRPISQLSANKFSFPSSSNGDHYVILPNGSLSVRDKDGEIRIDPKHNGLWPTAQSKGNSGAGGGTSTSASNPPASQASVPGSQWLYSSNADPMSKGTTYHAQVQSTNSVEFKFPYSGPQYAMLSLRTDPRHGKDVIFRIKKGQILCHSYENCSVLVRFDDEQASNYSAVGAADNSTETIFLRNYDRFVGKLAKAKRVRLSVNIYQEGAPVFEFDVGGFDPSRYKAGK